MKMKVALVFMLVVFLMLVELECKKSNKLKKSRKHKKGRKEIIKTENTEIFKDKDQDPKNNAKTKLSMMRKFVASVLDQLEIPELVSDNAMAQASPSALVACMNTFKDIARKQVKAKEALPQLETHLPGLVLKEKLIDDKLVARAEEFINTHISKKDA